MARIYSQSMTTPEVRRRARGFSLIELMIALAILIVGIVGIMGAVLMAQRNEMATREKKIAQNAARKVLERIRGTPFNEVFSTYQNYTFDARPFDKDDPKENSAFDSRDLTPREGALNNQVGLVTINNTDPNLLDVTVAVEWVGAYPSTTVSFRTLVTER